MLVANPGQTPYSLISKKPCHGKPAKHNDLVSSSIKYIPSSSASITHSASAIVSKKMTAVSAVHSTNETNALKSLSVRISRETDLLKNTVHKAIISKIPSQLSSALNLYAVPPTNIHRFPERTDSLSVDSLKSEMCHFKPIRTVPTTPTKRSKAIVIKTPKAKLALKDEPDCDETEVPKPSSDLSAAIVSTTSSRMSAFSYVGLVDNTSTFSERKQQHKAKSKSAVYCNQISEENLSGKDCLQPRVLIKQIVLRSSDAKAIEEFTAPSLVKHCTRRLTKTSTTVPSIVEHQKSQPYTESKKRATRKRPQTSRNQEKVPVKNAKLTKDCSKSLKCGNKQAARTERRRPNRRTPPVTRSRLKQSMILTRKQYQNN